MKFSRQGQLLQNDIYTCQDRCCCCYPMVSSFCLIALCSKLLEGWLPSTLWKPEASFGCGHACEMAQGLVTSCDTQVMGENPTFRTVFQAKMMKQSTTRNTSRICNMLTAHWQETSFQKCCLEMYIHQCRFCGMGVDSGPTPHP